MAASLQETPRAADTGGVGLSASAFTAIYTQHMPELTRYCRGILRDRDDAEDAAQTAMERALKALTAGPPPERMRPWLLTIAQREAINVLRRRRHAAPGELDERRLAPQPSAEELSATRERLAQLMSDLQALTARQREVLVARELGGRSYRQIATELGTSEAAAQQLVLEARRSLRQFESGRALDCDAVQSWISAHDHARMRTRRVRAHLRSCTCCQGFERGIRSRRRDLALLLPGLGGGAWSSPLAALLGGAAGKAVTAGAVVLTGATLAGLPALSDHLPRDPAQGPAAARPSTSTTSPSIPRLRGTHPAVSRPAARDPLRRRTASGAPATTGGPHRGATSAPRARSQPARQAGAPTAAPDRGPQRAPTAAPPRPQPTPTATATPTPQPQLLPDVGATAEQVTGTVEQAIDQVTNTVDEVVGKLPLSLRGQTPE